MTDHLKFKPCERCQAHLNQNADFRSYCESCNNNIYVIDRLKAIADPGCICGGNWRKIVKDHEDLFGRKYREVRTGNIYELSGLVHAPDDYYYLLQRPGDSRFLSCVGSIEGFGYTLLEDGYCEYCPHCGKGVSYYPTDEHPVTTSASRSFSLCVKTGAVFTTTWQENAYEIV